MNYFDEIKSLIEKKTSKKNITINSSFKDLDLDSLDILDSIVELEEKIKIKLSDDELTSIKTIKQLIETIEKHKK